MALADTLLPEFDQEIAATRRLLARAPEHDFDWRPHDKSFTLGGLCTHLAAIPHWGEQILGRDGYDLVTDAVPRHAAKASVVDVLATFDQHVAEVRAALIAAGDAGVTAPWSLRRDGTTLFTQPKLGAFRTFVLSHLIHHRGQLSVYLRLRNVPLPPVYGPTADEGM